MSVVRFGNGVRIASNCGAKNNISKFSLGHYRVVRPEHYPVEARVLLPMLLSAAAECERHLAWAEAEYRRAALHLADLKALVLDTVDAIQALNDGRRDANEAWLDWCHCHETYIDLWEASRTLSGHPGDRPPKRNHPPEAPPDLG